MQELIKEQDFGPMMEECIRRHVVGLLEVNVVDGQENADTLGTAVAVKIGNRRGLITASHVVDEFSDQVGVLCFQSWLKTQQFKVEPKYFDITQIKPDGAANNGPDIAFIQLPESIASTLEAKISFLELSKEFEQRKIEKSDRRGVQALAGCIKIFQEKVDAPSTSSAKKLLVNAKIIVADNKVKSIDKNDEILEFIPDYENNADIPVSYGGVSGGPLIQFLVAERDDGFFEFQGYYLLGIAFWETDSNKGLRHIYCNKIDSIRQRLSASE